jgi:glucokinase
VLLVNDFEAVGTSLPHVSMEDRVLLHTPTLHPPSFDNPGAAPAATALTALSPPARVLNCDAPTPTSAYLGATAARDGGVFAVLGPGTGLGQCFGVWHHDTTSSSSGSSSGSSSSSSSSGSGHYKVYCAEGGVSDFAARSENEWKLRQWLGRRGQRNSSSGGGCRASGSGDGAGLVEVEWVVSGAGIANIYRWAVEEFGPTEGVDQVLLSSSILSLNNTIQLHFFF